jgi:hypothetical protein
MVYYLKYDKNLDLHPSASQVQICERQFLLCSLAVIYLLKILSDLLNIFPQAWVWSGRCLLGYFTASLRNHFSILFEGIITQKKKKTHYSYFVIHSAFSKTFMLGMNEHDRYLFFLPL